MNFLGAALNSKSDDFIASIESETDKELEMKSEEDEFYVILSQDKAGSIAKAKIHHKATLLFDVKKVNLESIFPLNYKILNFAKIA